MTTRNVPGSTIYPPVLHQYKIDSIENDQAVLTNATDSFICPKAIIPVNLKVGDDVAITVEQFDMAQKRQDQTTKAVLNELIS
ncbi:MAG: hypothetical protein WC773_03150 [Patescibacteria group bacterium]|jgi:hypothetical protein